ncbi:PREDICTED: uncharacterized protein LOC109154283 [Ipomoea nil]|uniref:uncharacterized protein LOC109154283 n=1 Tax=Ipomoea nil TaxID=35883 RepID=UPI000901C6C7|nr:PREDICTED: uncharacterized protein LOC109154283 [Ipomoea nil]
MLRRSLVFLENWKSANLQTTNTATSSPSDKWSRTGRGMLKLNTDAALHSSSGTMSLSWVLRDDEGRFLACKNMFVQGNYTVMEAGALSVREALSWLLGIGMGNVEVEMDCQIVFNVLRSSSFSSSFGLLIDDVKELATAIGGVEFVYARRSANCATDTVARGAFSETDRGEWFDTSPHFLVDCLDYDLMN